MDKRRKDKGRKDKRQSFRLSVLPPLVFLLLCAACAAVKPVQQADSDFYRESSEKMGVSFSGTEDKELIKASSAWMGVPYRYGGEKKSGVDCSGFVFNVFKEAYGVTLPRNSAAMSKQVRRVRKSDMQCGDLVFFSVKEKRVSHVGIYMGGNKFVHSSASYGVSVADLGDTYWSKHFSGAGRVAAVAESAQKAAAADASVSDSKAAVQHKRTASRPAGKGKPHAAQPSAPPPAVVAATAAAADEDEVIVVFDEEF